MRRREDWPARLNALIEASLRRPFAWGAHDCCLFAAAAVQAMTGVDPAEDLRGTYKTPAGAARALKRYGGVEGAAATFAGAHGFAEIPPLLAQRGDVVLLATPNGPALGVIDLRGHIAATGPEGLIFQPPTAALRAWRI